MAKIGRTLKIFVMGDDSHALRTVELSNWTGLAFIGSRNHLAEIRNREELSVPAVYLLLSEDSEEGGALTDFYVGETDNFTGRIGQHVQSKDWWDTFVVFVSKDQNLTKAHVKHLERDLYLLARQSIATLRIKNTTEPGGAKLPESDVSSMEEFLQNIRFVLETLGLSYFPSQTKPITEAPAKNTSVTPLEPGRIDGMEFTMNLPKDLGLNNGEPFRGHMQVVNGGFVLKAGSFVRAEPHDSFEKHDSYFALWKQVVQSDSVKPSNNKMLLITTKDIEFRSPSAAGAVVRGRSTNGRTEWKRVIDSKPLVECEADQIKGKEQEAK